MTGFPRHLGPLIALLALVAPAVAAPQGDVGEQFGEGVQLLARGRDKDALTAFQKVLALDPSNEAAYELWKNTEHQVWIELMAKQGRLGTDGFDVSQDTGTKGNFVQSKTITANRGLGLGAASHVIPGARISILMSKPYDFAEGQKLIY